MIIINSGEVFKTHVHHLLGKCHVWSWAMYTYVMMRYGRVIYSWMIQSCPTDHLIIIPWVTDGAEVMLLLVVVGVGGGGMFNRGDKLPWERLRHCPVVNRQVTYWDYHLTTICWLVYTLRSPNKNTPQTGQRTIPHLKVVREEDLCTTPSVCWCWVY